MSHALDLLPQGPLDVTHVGGGAGTLVRWISYVRPRSSHIVLEPDAQVTDLVRARLPFARGTRVRIRPVDGRAGMTALGPDTADCVVVDAFAGARVPADLVTTEFAAQVARVLRDTGVVLVNVGDGSNLEFTRRMAAAYRSQLAHLVVCTDKSVLSGRRFGNVVVMASATPLPVDDLRRSFAREPFPVHCLAGAEVERWLGAAVPFIDGDTRRSPAPPFDSWRVAAE